MAPLTISAIYAKCSTLSKRTFSTCYTIFFYIRLAILCRYKNKKDCNTFFSCHYLKIADFWIILSSHEKKYHSIQTRKSFLYSLTTSFHYRQYLAQVQNWYFRTTIEKYNFVIEVFYFSKLIYYLNLEYLGGLILQLTTRFYSITESRKKRIDTCNFISFKMG